MTKAVRLQGLQVVSHRCLFSNAQHTLKVQQRLVHRIRIILMGCGSISHPWGHSDMGKTYYRHASEEEAFCGLSSSPPYSHRALFLVLATPKILCKVQTFLETDSTHEGGCGKVSLYIFFSVLYFVKMLFLVMSLNHSETEIESK